MSAPTSATRGARADARTLTPESALLHPLWLGALALLAINDHVLKGAGVLPGWLTGKLSDFAGLLVAPALVAALLRVRTVRGLAHAHVAVGIVFTVLELSTAASRVFAVLMHVLGFGWRTWQDVTDLLALPMLAISFVVLGRAMNRRSQRETRVAASAPRPDAALASSLAGHAQRAALLAGSVACMATSQEVPPPSVNVVTDCVDCDSDGWPAPLDCDDQDASINPDTGYCDEYHGEDACDDGEDNDGDGQIDCEDADCGSVCANVNAVCSSSRAGLVMLPAATPVPISGTTLGGSTVFEGTCGGADAPEATFKLRYLGTAGSPATVGILEVVVTPAHTAHLRSVCSFATTELACVVPEAEATETVIDLVITDATYDNLLTIEAADGLSVGEFTATATFWPLACGDGLEVEPEQCDDGNLMDGDGCSSGCELDFLPFCESASPLTIGDTPGDLIGGSTVFEGTCGGAGPERTYRYTAAETGTLSMNLNSTGNLTLHVRDACDTAVAEVECSEAAPAGGEETATLPVTAGETYYVFVDAAAGPSDAAPFILTAAFAP